MKQEQRLLSHASSFRSSLSCVRLLVSAQGYANEANDGRLKQPHAKEACALEAGEG